MCSLPTIQSRVVSRLSVANNKYKTCEIVLLAMGTFFNGT